MVPGFHGSKILPKRVDIYRIMSICNCFSLGIDDPITKTAAGSERVYYQQLAKEMFLILDQPIQVVGGERL
jgi:hypothetical protein